ncbi:unnamed protein product [Medioppia subpectinata]|uniref:Uncharacterized protein n=1 Tax=Medioppia subpectinata TaxID=1979941 RepID=A0A7R9L1H1_9ACAR|nr:unnamed protein product [Medioppia subpectinata]CAG2113842.1 unnamed protein product [Medioppia subpectinata]
MNEQLNKIKLLYSFKSSMNRQLFIIFMLAMVVLLLVTDQCEGVKSRGKGSKSGGHGGSGQGGGAHGGAKHGGGKKKGSHET